MSLVFFYAPWSTASVTHLVLEELGVPYEKERIDFAKRDQDAPRFRALNPNGKVPVVVHDGTAVFESAAISAYLGETFGVARDLYPAPGPARGKALAWLAWANVTLGNAYGTARRASADAPDGGERVRDAIAPHLRVLDAELGARPWILGPSFSIVDAHLVSFAAWMTSEGVDLGPYPNVKAWLAKAQARPAWARVVAG